jgi:hypothetical protein
MRSQSPLQSAKPNPVRYLFLVAKANSIVQRDVEHAAYYKAVFPKQNNSWFPGPLFIFHLIFPLSGFRLTYDIFHGLIEDSQAIPFYYK